MQAMFNMSTLWTDDQQQLFQPLVSSQLISSWLIVSQQLIKTCFKWSTSLIIWQYRRATERRPRLNSPRGSDQVSSVDSLSAQWSLKRFLHPTVSFILWDGAPLKELPAESILLLPGQTTCTVSTVWQKIPQSFDWHSNLFRYVMRLLTIGLQQSVAPLFTPWWRHFWRRTVDIHFA